MSKFPLMPSISIPRSRFKQYFEHPTTLMHGELVPLDCFEVIAGDGFSLRLSSAIRMSTPVFPFIGNIKAKIHAFFIPMRLLWDKWEEFFGVNKNAAGPNTSSYSIPCYRVGSVGMPTGVATDHRMFYYLGYPRKGVDASDQTKLISLPLRAYWLVWSTWYRAMQVQDPFVISTTQGNNTNLGTIGGSSVTVSDACAKVCKEFDYFTAGTLAPQFGGSVTLPLGSTAPVLATNSKHDLSKYPIYWKTGATPGATPSALTDNVYYRYTVERNTVGDPTNQYGEGYGQIVSSSHGSTDKLLFPENLWADLSTATAASINTIRYAFQLQKYLERSNYVGARGYHDILKVHYGVTNPDARLQYPEYLGGVSFDLLVQQVLSTAGATNDATTKLGAPGAYVSVKNVANIFNKQFTEPGYIMTFVSTKHTRYYSNSVPRYLMKFDRFEYYTPEFANLGDQETKLNELWFDYGQENDIFNYQEYAAEYRYRVSRASGCLSPYATVPLTGWVLESKVTSKPSFDANWIVEDRAAIANVLSTGATGPDYIADFFFDYTSTREMPLHVIPGLVDHFGAQ